MKIVIAADTYYPDVNGASYFAQRLAEGLARRGHEVVVIKPSKDMRHETFVHEGVSIYCVRSFPLIVTKFRTGIPITIAREIRRILKEFGPDIVHIQSHFAVCRTVLFEAEKLGIPILGTNHFMPDNITHYVPAPKVLTPALNNIMWRDFARIFNRLPLVTTPTESARRLILSKGITVPIRAISCGINLKVFSPRKNNEEKNLTLAEKYHIDVRRPTLMFVGRHDREKQIEMIIRALGMARNRSIQFVSVGKSNDHGSEFVVLRRAAKVAGVEHRVIFTGFIPDDELPDIYRLADGFAIACPAELQSIATMQALATGLAVIAINKVALPELVKDSVNGYLFSGDSIHELAEKIDALFTSKAERERMGIESLRIIQSHDITKVIDEYERLYTSLAPLDR